MKFNLKKLVAPGIVILIVAVLAIFAWRQDRQIDLQPEPKEEVILPNGWAVSAVSQEDFELKIEKRAEDSLIRPTIVLISSDFEGENQEQYLDQLIAGAKRAIPSLRITQDELDQQNGWITRDLVGFYQTGGDRINLRQRVYIKDSQVYTITASYGVSEPEEISDQIDQIFDQVFEEFIAF